MSLKITNTDQLNEKNRTFHRTKRRRLKLVKHNYSLYEHDKQSWFFRNQIARNKLLLLLNLYQVESFI